MKNKKGFTLTELLVAVVILGIVTGMSFPIIRRIRETKEKKQYEIYSDSIVHSSKLYVDSYDLDLFGYSNSGCTYITYEMLKERKLDKDIDKKDLSCYSDNTFVKVIKMKDKYKYVAFLGCGEKKSGKITNKKDITVVYPEADSPYEKDLLVCGGSTGGNMEIVLNPENQPTYKHKVVVDTTIRSATGIKDSNDIRYIWTKNYNYKDPGGWGRVRFKVKSESEQENDILSNKTITSTSKITSPPDANGTYYLVLRVDILQDIYGTLWKTDNAYIRKGPYLIDTTPPKIENYTVTSQELEYNTKKVNIKFDGSDNLTSQSDLKMCVSKSSTCTNYVPYKKESTFDVSSSYDGSTSTVHVFLKDLADNITEKTVTYKVYKTCDDYKQVDGSTCTVSCGGGTYNLVGYDKHLDNTRCSQYDKSSGGSACNTQPCVEPVYLGAQGILSASSTGSTTYSLSRPIAAGEPITGTTTSGNVSCSGSGYSLTCTVSGIGKSTANSRDTCYYAIAAAGLSTGSYAYKGGSCLVHGGHSPNMASANEWCDDDGYISRKLEYNDYPGGVKHHCPVKGHPDATKYSYCEVNGCYKGEHYVISGTYNVCRCYKPTSAKDYYTAIVTAMYYTPV